MKRDMTVDSLHAGSGGIQVTATNYANDYISFMVYDGSEETFNIGDIVTLEVTVRK